MPVMPAVCDYCGTIFSSGVFLENTMGTFKGNKAGPCPKCGKMGHIPDGVFNFVENAIQILNAPERTVLELRKFTRILEDVSEQRIPQEELQNEVEQEVPELSPILDLLPKTREEKREDYKWAIEMLLQVLFALLAFFSSASEENAQGAQKIEVNQVINQIYVNNQPAATLNAPTPTTAIKDDRVKQIPIKSEKIGRNSPCLCGSGVKYKKCHGNN
ncbi:SEC-C metal-binding domain-containing protein [Bacillus sp. ISL-45]|uniref:SEC-C metal-binding domain-containing protein n=1 Tax=Bacillus sp. ISL-45 TaxID=2819128 RepID=UPI001BEBCF9A|nr:SEC-C metal-binding domain-containing protein [Bacillus sp. ISL-45]MBT2660588.1 SEC-C domain-containing protein [Bacillus sp. ISL-45]